METKDEEDYGNSRSTGEDITTQRTIKDRGRHYFIVQQQLNK
jgi:hypothetical protein